MHITSATLPAPGGPARSADACHEYRSASPARHDPRAAIARPTYSCRRRRSTRGVGLGFPPKESHPAGKSRDRPSGRSPHVPAAILSRPCADARAARPARGCRRRPSTTAARPAGARRTGRSSGRRRSRRRRRPTSSIADCATRASNSSSGSAGAAGASTTSPSRSCCTSGVVRTRALTRSTAGTAGGSPATAACSSALTSSRSVSTSPIRTASGVDPGTRPSSHVRPGDQVLRPLQQLALLPAGALGGVREVDGERLAEPVPHRCLPSPARGVPNGNADCSR